MIVTELTHQWCKTSGILYTTTSHHKTCMYQFGKYMNQVAGTVPRHPSIDDYIFNRMSSIRLMDHLLADLLGGTLYDSHVINT